MTLKGHGQYIGSISYFPDGQRMVSGSDDATARQWDLKEGKEIEEVRDVYHEDTICAVAVFPDRRQMVTGSRDKTLRIWDLETGVVLKKMEGHSSENLSLAWTPDGTRLLSGGDEDDPTIREWDSLTWQQVGHPWEGHTSHIWAIAINPAGTLVASASNDNHVRLWRLSDRQNIGVFQHSSGVYTVTFSVDGRHILSGGGGNKTSEWEVPTGAHAKVGFHF
ncbi:WD40 repeat-like protein [Suillus brevipes Sb2]|nr:WD40 repeat-like protein [Suillus brevipes Sb2]